MNFGKLDRQIEIEKYTLTRTTSGAMAKSWESLGIFWAKVDFNSGHETYEAEQEQAIKVIKFIIRYSNVLNLNESMRLIYNDDYFNILSINETERNKYQVIEAVAKTVNQEL